MRPQPPPIDEHIERLIVRRLDGRLDAAGSLELDKVLLRSPEARRYAEDLERVDAAGSAVLHTLTRSSGGREEWSVRPETAPAVGRRAAGLLRRASIAAAVALVLGTVSWRVIPLPDRQDQAAGPPTAPAVRHSPSMPSSAVRQAGPALPVRPVADIEGVGRPAGRPREVIGVLDSRSGNLYMLEKAGHPFRGPGAAMQY